MSVDVTPQERRESTHVLGEMAAQRLHALLKERFEALRVSEGLTKADLATRLGIAEQLVSRWLCEPRNMTVKSAGRLAAALEAHLLFDLDTFEMITGSNGCLVHPSNRAIAVNVKFGETLDAGEVGVFTLRTLPFAGVSQDFERENA